MTTLTNYFTMTNAFKCLICKLSLYHKRIDNSTKYIINNNVFNKLLHPLFLFANVLHICGVICYDFIIIYTIELKSYFC